MEKKREREGVGVRDNHRMPSSFSSNRSSQQDSEQGAITDALGLHMLTSRLDFGSCYVNLIHDDTLTMTGGFCLPGQDEGILKYHIISYWTSMNLQREQREL